MSIKPILFNTDMVRAILDGKKTVTRRMIPERILEKYYDYDEYCNCVMPSDILSHRSYENEFFMSHARYHPGDILYIRETWAKLHCVDLNGCTRFDQEMYFYAADGIPDITLWNLDGFEEDDQRIRWRPSIHMPKEAARIWLKVTDVRVERLQDITDDDCMKEGIQAWTKDGKLYKYYPADKDGDFPNCEWSDCPRSPMDAMIRVWNSTIKKSELDRYDWDANPWVWVIEFERCEKPEPCILSGMEPAEDKRPCIGYQKSKEDDEPCEMCKECRRYYGDTQ